ncbi:MAG: thiol:disulfide interchange protein DsbA/DsbL [Azoarcus sp.]|jgi:thiol:disulfide interchange protein DsbA|nr:thiol:disulfide interchange protein DsbA/DsbL [Azoarcus sp.]
MNRRNALQRLGVLALLASPVGLVLGHGHGHGHEQKDFQELKSVIPVMSPGAEGKIEVLGFFHYGCSHCREFEPLLAQWAGRLPGDVVFAKVPVVWGKGLDDLARMHYALQVSKRADLHKAIFAAVQDQRLNFGDPKVVRNWAKANKLDVSAFMGIYNSNGVDIHVKRAQQTGGRYRIDSVPTIAVGGRFLTSPSMTGSYEAALKIVDSLIERVRKG